MVLVEDFARREIRLIGNEFFYLFILGVIGGLLTGLLQVNLVRVFSQKGIWWVVISPLAWGIACLGITGRMGKFGLFISGGVAIGVITGIAMLWLLRREDIDKVVGLPKRMETSQLTS